MQTCEFIDLVYYYKRMRKRKRSTYKIDLYGLKFCLEIVLEENISIFIWKKRLKEKRKLTNQFSWRETNASGMNNSFRNVVYLLGFYTDLVSFSNCRRNRDDIVTLGLIGGM